MHGAQQGQQGQHGSITYEIPFWAVALQSVKFSSIFRDMRLSPANWMCLMFFGFIVWLYSVSWIRHHEAFANQMLGTSQPRQAVNRKFWNPNFSLVSKPNQPSSLRAPIAAPPGSAAATSLAAAPFPPAAHAIQAPITPAAPLSKSPFVWPALASSHAYRSPMPLQNPRVKTIVNR
jgi:hypothetical protein